MRGSAASPSITSVSSFKTPHAVSVSFNAPKASLPAVPT
jgi:hypothetical protein